MGVSEYKEIAAQLGQKSVLAAEDAARLRVMAGYRNRLVHFYHEVSPEELFDICSTQLTDLTAVAGSFRQWIRSNADQIDDTL